MNLKNNLIAWGSYTLIIYILICYFEGYLYSISLSIIIGFVLSILNSISQNLNEINKIIKK